MALSDILKKYFAPTPNVRVRDVLNPLNLAQGAKKTATGIGRGVVGSGQSSLRGFAALGGAVTGKPLTPSTYFQRQLYGTDKPITLSSFGSEVGIKQTQPTVTTREKDGFAFPDYPTSRPGQVIRADLNISNPSIFKKDADIVLNLISPTGEVIEVPQSSEKLSSGDKMFYGLEARIPEDAEDGQWEMFVSVNGREVPDTRRTHTVLPGITEDPLDRYRDQAPTRQLSEDKEQVSTNLKDFAAPVVGFALSAADLIPGGKQTKTAVQAVTKGGKALTATRGFIESAKDVIPRAVKIAGQYVPRGTDDLAIKAKNFIKEDLIGAERYALENADDRAVAVASELLKKYADDAVESTDPRIVERAYDRAAEIANTLAPKLTEQGRSIQAASILGRLTPEGQLRFAAREIQKYNEANPLKKIPEITGQQSEFILTEMKAINAMEEGTEKAMRFQKLQNYIKDLVPTPLIEKVISVWKAGLLTGIKTQGLNIFSNLFHGISETVKDVPATAVDSVASLFTGQRTKTLTAKGVGGGLKEGFEKGLRYFKTGYDERNIAAKLDYKQTNFGKGKVAKAFQTYTDTVFRFLGAQDQPFYYGALTRSLNDQALAQAKNAKLKGKEATEFAQNLVENPTEEMIRYAVLDAQTAVFQNKTKLGSVARDAQKLGGGLGEIVLPFAKTPSAVAMQIINYSPIGVVKTIAENIGKGKFNQRLFSQGIGRGLTGTAVMFIGMELYKNKLMSLDFPVGDEREQELQKAEGKRDNAIKIGGKWRSPIALGPGFGNLLLIGGHLQNAIETSGSPTEAMFKALRGAGKSFTQQTFMTGVEDFVNAITNPERYAKSYLPGLVASAIPTIVGDVAKATDPNERRTGGESILEIAQNRIQAKIPGARNQLEPQVDILGREREAVGNPLELMADPTRPTTEVGTVVTEELRRLTDAGFRVSPTLLGDKNGYEGLTPEENTELWKYAGDIVNDKLTSLFSREEYQTMSDAEKGKIVEKIVNQAKVNARAGFAIELTQGLQGEGLKKRLSELKMGGLLTKEVFSKYLELR